MQIEETIVAQASTHDSGGMRGIVRVSGPETVSTISSVFACDDPTVDLQRIRSARRIPGMLSVRDPIGAVPCELFLWPTHRSYTRQPTAELHTFGALPLLNAIVETVCQQGARPAKPGEFTLRAFLAGRIDLAQAEAVLGVIDAADQRELSVALAQLAGGLSQPLDQMRNTLLNLCADLEAGLDFVEEDIHFVTPADIERELRVVDRAIHAAIAQMSDRGTSGQLPRVVLRGEPNVGKSSLWNAMCTDAQAIVTDQAGTTRDYLIGTVLERDTKFALIDTAGVEQNTRGLDDSVRAMTDSQAATAELILFCIDSSRPLTSWEERELEKTQSNRLVVMTKCDLPRESSLGSVSADVQTSERDPTSMRELISRCARELETLGDESTVVSSTSARCRSDLEQAGAAVARAIDLNENQAGDELIAAELRAALDHLGQIVGVIYTDDILDRVFSRFCIGK